MIAMLCFGAASAQSIGGFSSGGASEGGIDAVLGMDLSSVVASDPYAVTVGLPFSQLVEEELTAYTGEQVNVHGITFNVPFISSDTSFYFPNVADLQYFDLRLNINPLPCSGTVADADGNTYHMVAVAGSCWTRENLKTTHYTNNAEVVNAMIFPNADVDTYGRLYTWFSAVNLPEDGSNITPWADGNGNVQGICPANWHIPTASEMEALGTKKADELNATHNWVGPQAPYHNLLLFTAEPAGKYNNALQRFEDLYLETGWWSNTPPASNTITTTTMMCIGYHCDIPFTKTVSLSDGYSVRCVKNKNI